MWPIIKEYNLLGKFGISIGIRTLLLNEAVNVKYLRAYWTNMSVILYKLNIYCYLFKKITLGQNKIYKNPTKYEMKMSERWWCMMMK